MAKFVLRRLVYAVAMLVAVSVFLFSLTRAAGDPRFLYLNEYTTKEQWDSWGKAMGLEKPLVVQYAVWASKAVKGDFGRSLRDQRPALSVVKERIPATLQLGTAAFIIAVMVAVPLGVMSAVKKGTGWDYFGRTFALFGQAMPSFWLGLMLIIIFAVQLRLLPTGQRGGPDHFILPAITLGWISAAGLLRLVRSAVLEVLDSEFIKLARAKGVGEREIIWKHALKNALIPPLTYSGIIFAAFITGSVVTETVFGWPGLGRLGIDAVNNNDFPVIVAVVSFLTLIYVGVALFVDVAYAFVDPRIRY